MTGGQRSTGVFETPQSEPITRRLPVCGKRTPRADSSQSDRRSPQSFRPQQRPSVDSSRSGRFLDVQIDRAPTAPSESPRLLLYIGTNSPERPVHFGLEFGSF
jgi:hypothetical protein